tara:strand:- start:808 stop:1131 length:324 start_codon:yes stop_codon:yes gene_type:complete
MNKMKEMKEKILDKKIIGVNFSEDINDLFNVEIVLRNVRDFSILSIALLDVSFFDCIENNLGYVESLKYFIRDDKTHYLSLDPDDTKRDEPLESDNFIIIAQDLKFL